MLLILEIETKLNNFCNKFQSKKRQFSPLNELVPCCATNQSSQIECIFQKVSKTIRALRDKKFKFTSENTFIGYIFCMRGWKIIKVLQKNSFLGAPLRVLTCLLACLLICLLLIVYYPPKHAYLCFSGLFQF